MAGIILKRLLDTTLREGEQTPGVYFTLEERLNIARMLYEVVGEKLYLELGIAYNPLYKPGVEDTLRHFREEGLKAKTLLHARALREDVDISYSCEPWGLVIYSPTSDEQLRYKFGDKPYSWILSQIKDAIHYAKNRIGFECVEYGFEDATSTPLEKILEAVETVTSAGADVVRIADTKGQMDPWSYGHLIERIVEETGAEIDVHCHNDRGFALANTIAGLRAGATGAHTSVRGLGERAGITDLATLAENLQSLYGVDTGIDFKGLPSLYQYVAACAGMPIPKDHPILGENTRTHKAGGHQTAVLRQLEETGRATAYETIDFSRYGLDREFEFGPMQSKELTRYYLQRLGLDPRQEVIDRITEKIRRLSSEKGRNLQRVEVHGILEEELGETIYTQGEGGISDAILELDVAIRCDEASMVKEVRKLIARQGAHSQIIEVTGKTDYYILLKGVKDLDAIISGISILPGIKDIRVNIILGEY